jgi:alpha/beta superfamily hydrolase
VEPVTFTTEDGVRLEGELRLPDAPPLGTAVICHPHPKHGGSKDHPILWALRNELAGARGIATLVFNFRGVMGSEGTYGGGHHETQDVRAAIDRVRVEAPERPTIVCGWSFGANVALREALDDPRVAALVLLGIPLDPNDVTLPPMPTPAELRALRRPVMTIAGDGDAYCPAEDLRAFTAEFGTAEMAILEGTDHYLWRREREAAEIAGRFVDRVLG